MYNDTGINTKEDITFIKIHVTNIGAFKYIKQMLTAINGEIGNNTKVVGNVNTQFTSMDRSSRQKISKETLALNDKLNQMDLTDIYRIFHPKPAEYTLFSSAHRTFSRADHTLGHKKVSTN